ncbi:MAG: tetratricopeptide repeat protein [Usitatibacteraceae bacterium]
MFTLLVAFSGGALCASTDEIRTAGQHYEAGNLTQALTAIDIALIAEPRNPQARFLKGLILTDQRKTQDAIQVFASLTEDFPDLPEPYNNLAVLYASEGNYDKARIALDLAIQTHPNYGTAFENLGDLYTRLARRSYEKALQLEGGNDSVQAKLTRLSEIFGSPSKRAVSQANATQKLPEKEGTSVATRAVTDSPDLHSNASASRASTENDGAKVASALDAWAKAWERKDVAEYLGHYAPSFEVPDNLQRISWESQRRERIERASRIAISIQILKISVLGNAATVVFRQTYRSDKVRSDNTKTIRMVRQNDRWLIASERTGS